MVVPARRGGAHALGPRHRADGQPIGGGRGGGLGQAGRCAARRRRGHRGGVCPARAAGSAARAPARRRPRGDQAERAPPLGAPPDPSVPRRGVAPPPLHHPLCGAVGGTLGGRFRQARHRGGGRHGRPQRHGAGRARRLALRHGAQRVHRLRAHPPGDRRDGSHRAHGSAHRPRCGPRRARRRRWGRLPAEPPSSRGSRQPPGAALARDPPGTGPRPRGRRWRPREPSRCRRGRRLRRGGGRRAGRLPSGGRRAGRGEGRGRVGPRGAAGRGASPPLAHGARRRGGGGHSWHVGVGPRREHGGPQRRRRPGRARAAGRWLGRFHGRAGPAAKAVRLVRGPAPRFAGPAARVLARRQAWRRRRAGAGQTPGRGRRG
mmetsp:Transcript_282/g.892  ORF Transcript_282/g.892 Transcript_282/m.892 type:complete len:375 (+) Transcript_282:1106-2230(+)